MLIVNDRLRSGAIARTGPIAVSYFITAQTEPILLGSSPLPGGAGTSVDPSLQFVYARGMECVGSVDNYASFAVLLKHVHQTKTNVRSSNL
jgi:hypothetical protein